MENMMPERPDDPATLAELNQLDPVNIIPVPPVPVIVMGDVRTQEQPDKLSTFSTYAVDSIRQLAQRDPRRSRITLWCASAQAVVVGTARSNVDGSIPTGGPSVILTQALGPVTLELIDELWCNTTTPGTPGLVCAVVEQWTD